MRGETIWIPNHVAFSPSHYQHVLIFSKESLKREKGSRTDTISRDQFLAYTKSIWKQDDGDDLYTRIVQLYSFGEDCILLILPKATDLYSTCISQQRKNSFFFMT